jgi:hypothetical protein
MNSYRFPSSRLIACGLLLASASASAQDRSPEGVVRISKPASATVRAQGNDIAQTSCTNTMSCGAGPVGGCNGNGCPGGADCLTGRGGWGSARQRGGSDGWSDGWGNGSGNGSECYGLDSWLRDHCHCCHLFHCGHHCDKEAMINYFRCKFGYFIPTGNGGAGTPHFGHYARVYPQDPNYFDQRDGQVWGASGYGTAVAVPLAPVVGHQWNYSWGTPAARLTPISRVAPY